MVEMQSLCAAIFTYPCIALYGGGDVLTGFLLLLINIIWIFPQVLVLVIQPLHIRLLLL